MTTGDFHRARSPQQQQQRRATILATARAMLDQLPPAEVSLRELSREVGLSKSNVVRYFPSREAVFLAVLIEDWDAWLADLAVALPRPDARRKPSGRHELVAAAIAGTLAQHRRFCDLTAACQSVLEHNVPVATAVQFKTETLERMTTLAELIRAAVPELDPPAAIELAGVIYVLVAGAWPMANPSPVVAEVLNEPRFAAMRVEFVPALTRVIRIILTGMTQPV